MVTVLDGAKAAICGAYDANAAGWATFADRLYFRFLAAPLVEALAGVEGCVLDVASGTGAVGRMLHCAVAADLSHAQLRHNPVVRRVQADAERLPFRDDAFAAAACAFGVNHFPDPVVALAEMGRVAPLVGILTWARDARQYRPRMAVAGVVESWVGTPRFRCREVVEKLEANVDEPPRLAAVVAAAGLVGEVQVVEVDVPWPGVEAYVDFRLAVGPDLGAQRDDVRAAAVAAVAALPEDAYPFRPPLLLVLARRGRDRQRRRSRLGGQVHEEATQARPDVQEVAQAARTAPPLSAAAPQDSRTA